LLLLLLLLLLQVHPNYYCRPIPLHPLQLILSWRQQYDLLLRAQALLFQFRSLARHVQTPPAPPLVGAQARLLPPPHLPTALPHPHPTPSTQQPHPL
jgi:hypothetical protein